jgi:hypothetical protein
MPRYFFHVRVGDQVLPDPVGEEMRDPDHAWEMARTTIRDLLIAVGKPANLLSAILEVTDADGELVLEFPFAEAIIDQIENPRTKH